MPRRYRRPHPETRILERKRKKEKESGRDREGKRGTERERQRERKRERDANNLLQFEYMQIKGFQKIAKPF